MFTGKLARLTLSLARAPLLEYPIEYPDEAIVWEKPQPAVVFHKAKVKLPPKKPFERITREVSYAQQIKDADLTAKIASGEVVRCKRATGGTWGVPKRVKKVPTINGFYGFRESKS